MFTFTKKEFQFALKNSIAIFFAYLFLGIAFGMLMNEAGYSTLTSTLSAVFIYAGSMQIIMVPMLHAGSPLYMLAIMTFFVNARHIFYGIGFIDRFRKMGWRYPYMIFSLTDETYSILCSIQYPEEIDPDNAAFLISLLNQSYWILGCFTGSCVGRFLPLDMSGIEFSATAFFLVVVINQLKQYKSKIPVLTGFVSALIFYLILGADYFLIPALSVSLITLVILRDYISKNMEVPHES